VEQLTLNCYRLAKFYGLNPDHFLAMPVSKIRRHMLWTEKLIERMAAEQEDAADGRF
jgi:hypothetical protein